MVDELDEAADVPSNRGMVSAAELERFAEEGRAMSLAAAVAYALEGEANHG
jgi:hypothetical protein